MGEKCYFYYHIFANDKKGEKMFQESVTENNIVLKIL